LDGLKHVDLDSRAFAALSAKLQYVKGDYSSPETFRQLRQALGAASRPLYYLAVPPDSFAAVAAGLANAECDKGARNSAERAMSALQFKPGTQYTYSNSNFYLLGSIIENLTGQSYAANLDQYIFHPLGLQDTYYDLPPANLAAAGYANSGAGLIPAIIWDRSAAFAAGALSSNVYDLVAWDNALMSGQVVSPASFQQMTTSNGFFQNGFSYGFGLALTAYSSRPIMWHAGQIGGFYTENVVFLDNGFTLVVLTNDQDYDTDPFVFKILNAVCGSSQLDSNC